MHARYQRLFFLVITLLSLVSCQQNIDDTKTPIPLATSTPIGNPEGTLITLHSPENKLNVGDLLDVTVEVQNVKTLVGAEIHLQFDADILMVVSFEDESETSELQHGDLLKPDFVAVNRVDNTAGTIDYAIAQMPTTEAVHGDGVLCRIRFKIRNEGSSRISIESVLLADKEGKEISTSIVNDSVEIVIQ